MPDSGCWKAMLKHVYKVARTKQLHYLSTVRDVFIIGCDDKSIGKYCQKPGEAQHQLMEGLLSFGFLPWVINEEKGLG